MASSATISWLVLSWVVLCGLSFAETAGIQPCERIRSCSCFERRVECVNGSFTQVPAGIPSDTLTLNLSHNNIQEIDIKKLSHLHSLQTLILHHNVIKSIPSWDSFPASLVVLSLHHNKIRAIPSFNTTKQHSLRSLYLHVNKISSIGPDAFTNLTRLKTLRLNRNKLQLIPSVALSRLSSLVTLDLRKNSIKSIPSSSFYGLRALKTLKLSKNQISGMEKLALFGLDKLEQLYLDGNNISDLQVNCFFGITDLQKLFLQNNKISQIQTDMSDWRALQLLRHINLSGNRLYRIDDLTFKHLLGLRTLNLAGNNIHHITNNAFADLQTLESLDLSNNSISWTAQEMSGPFSGLKNLVFLRLDNNRITTISEKAFSGLSNLKFLNLSENAISTIEENAFSSIKQIANLWLNTSHLTCNCKVKWLVSWIKTNLKSVDFIVVRCRLPLHLQSKSIFNISSSSFVCDFSNPAPQIIRHPVSTDALIGQNVTLQCDVHVYQKNQTNVQLSWLRDHHTITANQIFNRAKATGENMVIYTTELRLVRVGFKDDGFYQCHASNKFGESFSNRAKLEVRQFPNITDKPTNVTVLAGATIRLPCAATGHPKPTISWRKDKGNTKFAAAEERRIIHKSGVFLITHSKAKDTGFYTCSATNDAGSVTARAYVTVLQIPRFMQSMTSKTVKEGESVVLECIGNGNPKPRISWFKDRYRLAFNSRVLTHLDGQILVIIKAELDDEGTYVCEVANRLGTARQTAELTVITGDTQVKSKEDKNIAFRYDKKTFLGIIVIVVVSCVVGTSLVWLFVIYCARRGSHRRQKNEAMNTNTGPRDDVSYIPLKSYSSGSTQTSRDSPRSTATFITSTGSQGSTFPPITTEHNSDCEKALTADTISSETSKGSHCSLASSCPSDESDPVRQVIHVEINNSDCDSCTGSPSHRKETDRDTQTDTTYPCENTTETSSSV